MRESPGIPIIMTSNPDKENLDPDFIDLYADEELISSDY